MSIARKCPKCAVWSQDVDYCSNCNELLSYEIKHHIQLEKKKAEEENKPLDEFDVFISKVKKSNNLLVRGVYYTLYSIWFIIAAIASFLFALVAIGPG